MLKKRFFAIMMVAVMAVGLVTLAGCDKGTAGADNELRFYTGGKDGVYYAYGQALIDEIEDKTDTKLYIQESGGSQDNIEALESGDAKIALAQSDIMAYAYNGSRMFSEDGAINEFCAIADLYAEQLQIVTCASDIRTVGDLEGKCVSIGVEGSGTYYNAIDMLSVYGLTEDDIRPEYKDFGDSIDGLMDGTIDAAIIVASAPTQAIEHLESETDFHLIALEQEYADALVESCPYYEEVYIPGDVYGLPYDTLTVAVDAVLLARNDVSDDDVYNILSTIIENKDEIAENDSHGAYIDLTEASSIATVPYHSGAAKYYAEQGITVKTR